MTPSGRRPLEWAFVLSRLLATSRAVYPENSPRRLWRCVMLFIQQIRWMKRLGTWHDPSNSAFVDILEVRPTLPVVVTQPYINASWNATRRLTAI